MCGIGGLILLEERNVKAYDKEVRTLLAGLQSRGMGASGLSVTDMKKPETRVIKWAKPAAKLAKRVDLSAEVGDIVLLHARAATQGSVEDSRNNHPILTKNGIALIHNGIVSNDKEVREKYKLVCDGEVDSEVILRMYEKKGIKKAIKSVSGSNAFVIADPTKGKAFFYADGNPLHISLVPDKKIIMFASEEDMMDEAVGTKILNFFNQTPKMMTYKLTNETLATFDFKTMQFLDLENVEQYDEWKNKYDGYKSKDNWHYVRRDFEGHVIEQPVMDAEADKLIREGKIDEMQFYGF
jgi:glucosamine 6-phosphate synthetase-like amidotransferase/phosphosugar isomerase protein